MTAGTETAVRVEEEPPSSPDSPPGWAVDHLRRTVAAAGGAGQTSGVVTIRCCHPGQPRFDRAVALTGAPTPLPPESFVLARSPEWPDELLVAGADDRGLVYALTELADVVATSSDLSAALAAVPSRWECPHVPVRSLSRMFTSHRLDSVWFHDRAFWDEYLTELVTHRFNRFSLAFGLGYDYLIDKRVTDNYLYFVYPFLLDVPGYRISVRGLGEEERAQNLATVRYVAAAARRRGLQFGLGLWNHAPRLDPATPTERWLVSGLDAEAHPRYCADALAALLTAVPEIDSLTLRVHFEGGVPEPTHSFWREVVSGLRSVGRVISLDAHAKGIDDDLLDALRSAGSPLTLSTKYWGEHMGLPYHQAAIREKEFDGRRRPRDEERGADDQGPGGEAGGRPGSEVTRARSFTRYGYADFARPDAGYRLLHRVWPGTQRVLLQGDPETCAGIGRQATFAGSVGVEWFDALTFLGKKDSAEHPIGPGPLTREVYSAAELSQPGATGWRRYRPQLRLQGRLAYDPTAAADGWRRWYRHAFGAAAGDAEEALAAASRILPLITTVHAPSVAGNIYWPEMDTPVPLVETDPAPDNPFADHGWHTDGRFDMEPPFTFGATSPLDPELFLSPDAFAGSLLDGRPSARYGPTEVAEWLELLAGIAEQHAVAAREVVVTLRPEQRSELRRLLLDVDVAARLGRFFAAKSRAAVAWRLHGLTGSPAALGEAVRLYRDARDWWAGIDADGDYVTDIPFGRTPYQRGHWRDRLPGIEDDLAAVVAHAGRCDCTVTGQAPSRVRRVGSELEHQVPDRLEPGRPLEVVVTLADPAARVRMRCRPVDQSQRWQEVELVGDGHRRRGLVPAELTGGPHALQYHFWSERAGERPDEWLVACHPGLEPPTLAGQPYFVVHPDPAVEWGRSAT